MLQIHRMLMNVGLRMRATNVDYVSLWFPEKCHLPEKRC